MNEEKANVVNVASNGSVSSFVGYALKVLEKQGEEGQNVVLRGCGEATGKTVSIVEIVKRKCSFDLYQTTQLLWIELPKKQKQQQQQSTSPTSDTEMKKVACIQVVLSKIKPTTTKTTNFQPPLTNEQRSISIADKRVSGQPRKRYRQ